MESSRFRSYLIAVVGKSSIDLRIVRCHLLEVGFSSSLHRSPYDFELDLFVSCYLCLLAVWLVSFAVICHHSVAPNVSTSIIYLLNIFSFKECQWQVEREQNQPNRCKSKCACNTCKLNTSMKKMAVAVTTNKWTVNWMVSDCICYFFMRIESNRASRSVLCIRTWNGIHYFSLFLILFVVRGQWPPIGVTAFRRAHQETQWSPLSDSNAYLCIVSDVRNRDMPIHQPNDRFVSLYCA